MSCSHRGVTSSDEAEPHVGEVVNVQRRMDESTSDVNDVREGDEWVSGREDEVIAGVHEDIECLLA